MVHRLAIAVALVALLPGQSTARSAASVPNVLLITAEDLSPRIGAFGDAVAHTPNLDQLASQGVRYTNTFTTAGVCAPSRAAHILSMYAFATHTQHMRTSGAGYAGVPPSHVKATADRYTAGRNRRRSRQQQMHSSRQQRMYRSRQQQMSGSS